MDKGEIVPSDITLGKLTETAAITFELAASPAL